MKIIIFLSKLFFSLAFSTTLFILISTSKVSASIGFANTSGGDDGTVYTVTTLEDADPAPVGSLRHAVEASGKRKIVFGVSGWIDLVKKLNITNPEITIDGSTAPNKGVGLRAVSGFPDNTLLTMNTNDVIIRYIRFRAGVRGYSVNVNSFANPGWHEVDALSITSENGGQARNIWIDHVDVSGGNDGNLDIWGGVLGAHDITISNSYIFQGLRYSTHDNSWVWDGNHWVLTSSHSMGSLVGHGVYNVSYVNNVFAHNGDRVPLFQDAWNIEVVNNLIYNVINSTLKLSIAGQVAGDPSGEWKVNMIGNRILNNGLNTNQSTGNTPRYALFSQSSNFNIYFKNNISQNRPNNSLPESDAYYSGSTGTLVGSAHDFNILESQTVDLSSDENAISLLNASGVTLPETDSLHDQIKQDVINGLAGNPTGTIIDFIDDGYYPNLSSSSEAPTLVSATNGDANNTAISTATSTSNSSVSTTYGSSVSSINPIVKLTQTTTGKTSVSGKEKTSDGVEFSGKAASDSLIIITLINQSGKRTPDSTSVDTNGNWSWNPPPNLEPGDYVATFLVQDKQGNTGSTTLKFTISEDGPATATESVQESSGEFVEIEEQQTLLGDFIDYLRKVFIFPIQNIFN